MKIPSPISKKERKLDNLFNQYANIKFKKEEVWQEKKQTNL